MRKRWYIVAKGQVQGVGFRWNMQMIAQGLDIGGWIRNLDNGDVDMEVEGEEEDLNLYLKKMLEGNRFIRVDDYAVKELPVKDERRFRVTY